MEEDSAQKKWDRLHSRLLALEESCLLPPSEVRSSSWELKCLIITFQIQKRKEKLVFLPCLIITFFEQKALCCLFGVMGTPAGLDKSYMCLQLFLRCFSLFFSLKVTDSSMRRSDGTAGRMIGAQNLKELQTLISHLRELGDPAAELLSQVRGQYHGCLSESV